MIQNFDEIKKQLGELSDIINGFKSEAVQLKIIELVLSGLNIAAPAATVSPTEASTSKRKARKRGTTVASSSDSAMPSNRGSSGSGAVATLTRVFEAGFFKEPRTINAVLQHCETNLAKKIRANEISGKLARMVRSNQLKRVKNSEGQYEYTNH